MEFPERLRNGYAAFRSGRLPADRERYARLAERGQRPEIMIIACCDSRSAPETIFDAAPGEMFVCRNVANLVPPFDADGNWHGTSAALEFGITRLQVRHLVIMGHGRCGGIAASLDPDSLDGTDFIGHWINLLAPARAMIADDPMEAAERQRALEFASIRQSIANLRTFPWIAAAEAAGTIALHGAWFDISTGELYALDGASGDFVSMSEAGQQALRF
ncbi:MAG: carbonic anhydrase [Bauldia sp.]|nr:carbonic anhydrase [Bauldia sp.]MCW5719028.1 carbonic anhydrase [Bauldia sp.]